MPALVLPEKFQGLYEPHRYKAMHGGRGGAKSHSCASALVTAGVQRPLRWLCAREVQKSLATSVKQLLEDKIVKLGLTEAYRSTERGIFGPNGTTFLFAGLRTNPDSIKSMEGLDGAWVEEANRCSQQSLDLLTPTLRKPGSEAWFTWNRTKTTDPVDNMFLGGQPPPDSWVQQVNWRDNPWFPEVLQVEMEWMRTRDPDKWRHVWEGEPLSRSEAKVFSNWTVDDLDDVVPEGCQPRFGADWGMRDPTVLVKVYRWGRTLYIAREAWKVNATIDEIPSLFAGSDQWRKTPRWENSFMHEGVEGAMDHTIVGDSASPQTIRYLSDRGFHMKPAIKGPGSLEEGVEFMKAHDIVIHPSCKHIADELAMYEHEVDPITDEVLPALKDKDNHGIDSVRYALEGERRSGRGHGLAVVTELIGG